MAFKTTLFTVGTAQSSKRQLRAAHTQPRVALGHSEGLHSPYAAFDATLAEATTGLLVSRKDGAAEERLPHLIFVVVCCGASMKSVVVASQAAAAAPLRGAGEGSPGH